MKTLYLVRHAKSSWDNAGISDFERPLNDRGLQSAPSMAGLLKENQVRPDIIISSPATRAIETAVIFCEVLGHDADTIRQHIEIYEGGVRNLQKIVQHIPDNCRVAMIFGHNPTMTEFSNFLTGKHIDNIVTCGIVRIDFGLQSWNEVTMNSGSMVSYDFPKKHQ
jgi:phosphohistidine phosphatase